MWTTFPVPRGVLRARPVVVWLAAGKAAVRGETVGGHSDGRSHAWSAHPPIASAAHTGDLYLCCVPSLSHSSGSPGAFLMYFLGNGPAQTSANATRYEAASARSVIRLCLAV